MAYYYPFGVSNKTLSSSFANNSVTASFSASASTKIISASFATTALYAGPKGPTGTSYSTPNCPAGYIECPSLSVPGYSRVCQQLGAGCPEGQTATCPASVPGCTTTTTSTSTTTSTTSTTTTSTSTTSTTTTSTSTTTTTEPPATTTSTSTTTTSTTTQFCQFQFTAKGPEATSNDACNTSLITTLSFYTDGGVYYVDPTCNDLPDSGYYKKSDDNWVEFNGSGQIINGPTSCTPPTTTSTTTPGPNCGSSNCTSPNSVCCNASTGLCCPDGTICGGTELICPT